MTTTRDSLTATAKAITIRTREECSAVVALVERAGRELNPADFRIFAEESLGFTFTKSTSRRQMVLEITNQLQRRAIVLPRGQR